MTINISDKTIKMVQIVIGVLFLISVGLNVWLLTKENKYKVVEKTVIREVRDTIHDTIPQIKYEKILNLPTIN